MGLKREKTMKRFILLLAAVLLTAVSCTTARFVTAQADLQSRWIGASHADIVRVYGAPTRECSDGAGGFILIYESFKTVYDTWLDGTPNYSREQRDFTEFYMDEKGVCYDVRSNDTVVAGRQFSLLQTLYACSLGLPLVLWLISM